MDRDDEWVALTSAVAYGFDQHAADHRAVLRLPGDLFLLAKRERLHLRIRIGELLPCTARADVVDRVDGVERRWCGAVRVGDQDHAGVFVAIDRDGALFFRQWPH